MDKVFSSKIVIFDMFDIITCNFKAKKQRSVKCPEQVLNSHLVKVINHYAIL